MGSMQMVTETTVTISQELQRHWNRKLGSNFALTPREKRGEIDKEKYTEWNREFDRVTSNYIRRELKLMRKDLGDESLREDVITVLGPGLARGLNFIPYANRRLNMRVELYDVSKRAIAMTCAFLRKKEVFSRNSTFHQEITGEGQEISQFSRLIVMSQFLQILELERMQSVMKMVARQMKLYPCRAIVVHPHGENTGWGDTTPYSFDELFAPVEEEIGMPPIITREQDIRYFDHHNYKAFTIQLS